MWVTKGGVKQKIDDGALQFWLDEGWAPDENLDGVDDGAGGTGTSSALSATKFAAVTADPTGVTVTAGGAHDVSFAGATIQTAEEFRGGAPATAVALGVTIDGTDVVLPDDDAIYDIFLSVGLTCDPADNGKLFGVNFVGNDASTTVWVPVVDGACSFNFTSVHRAYVGDSPTCYPSLYGEFLTEDATLTLCQLIITER